MHEVSKHKTVDDCWVVAHGKVYNITEFVQKHPGGKFVIKSNAGRDVSRHFDNHPKKAHIIWENYLMERFLNKVVVVFVSINYLPNPEKLFNMGSGKVLSTWAAE